jgi:hypothetical protein
MEHRLVASARMKDLENIPEITLFRAECSALSSKVKMFSVLLLIAYQHLRHILQRRTPKELYVLVVGKSPKVKLCLGKSPRYTCIKPPSKELRLARPGESRKAFPLAMWFWYTRLFSLGVSLAHQSQNCAIW